MSKFCTECGKELNDSAYICPNCGVKAVGPVSAGTPAVNTGKTNGMAIAGFILSFFAPLVGLILSIVGLNQCKKSGENGSGLALAGIIISVVAMLLAIIVIIVAVIAAAEATTYIPSYRYW